MGPLTLLALLGHSLVSARVARVPHAQGFFFATAFVILALYFGAFAGVLWWTALAVHVSGIALLGLEAVRRARQQAAFSIPVPYGLLLLLCAWFWIVHGADRYFLFDEFAHWGVFTKEMLDLDGFWTGETSSKHPRYLPGATLWQYLFNAFQPYSEGRTYFAHFVLLLAPLLLLWNRVRWSQLPWILAILALVLVAVANLGLGVSTLYVDQIEGVWYLGTILAAFADENLASRRVALYAAPLAVLALLKDSGLALAASGAIIVSMLFCSRLLAPGATRVAWKTSAALAVLLLPMLLCVQAWSWNRDAVGAAEEVQSVEGVLSGVVHRTGADNEVESEIERRLAEVFFDQQLSNSIVSWDYYEFTYGIRELFTDSYRLTTFGLLVAFAIWWIAVAGAVLRDDSRREWTLVAGGVLITAVVYIAALHLSYRFAFGARGLDLPSYVRYVNVVALPMFLLSLSALLPVVRRGARDEAWLVHGWAVPKRAAVFAVGLVAFYVLEPPYLRPVLQPNPAVPIRASFEQVAQPVGAAVGKSRLWIYLPGDDETDIFVRILRYLLVPTPTTVELSEHFLEGEDAARIAAKWRSFDYVWITQLPSVEAGIGLARFSGGTAHAGLYHVRSSDGEIRLESVASTIEAD
jgi:hypothetical protein